MSGSKKKTRLTLYIFIALFLGILSGWLFPEISQKFLIFGTIFLNMIKMIIAPLLFATLVVGIAGHGDIKSLGKLGFKTIIYFEIVTTLALAIGLIVGNVFKPGLGFAGNINNEHLTAAAHLATSGAHNSLSELMLSIFPTSIINSLATNNLLQIVLFSIFFALAICAVGQKAKPVLDFFTAMSEVMFKFTEFVMLFAPIGIFGTISATIGANGIGILVNYAKIIGSLYFALILFISIVLYIVCLIVKISLKDLVKAIAEPALLTFSTASSEAGFPKAMEIMEEFGVPKNIVGFVMPTGYTFNLDGSTLYLALAVLFSTQIVGIDLSIHQQIIIMLTLMLTSKGIAGVPRVSLIVLAGTLVSFNFPIVGVAILLGIDQILDMGRATVNLIGNCIATVVMARWENEFDYDKMHKYIEENS